MSGSAQGGSKNWPAVDSSDSNHPRGGWNDKARVSPIESPKMILYQLSSLFPYKRYFVRNRSNFILRAAIVANAQLAYIDMTSMFSLTPQ